MKRASGAVLFVIAVVAALGCGGDPEGEASKPSCGGAGQPCCEGGCEPKLRCDGAICVAPESDIGLPCTSDRECLEGVCIPLAGASGGVTHVCSRPCTIEDECTKGWQCTHLAPGRAACTCAQSAETCDGRDNDCNGAVDDGAADDACASEGAGQHACRSGLCECVTRCGGGDGTEGVCVDARVDVENCGGCGRRCASAEICANGRCLCEGAVCDGVCVDTRSDNRHCGGCGSVCDYQCQGGECRPAIVLGRDPSLLGPTKSNVHRVLALDSTRIYFVHSKPGELMFTDRPEQIRACPLSGCVGPPDELIDYQQTTQITNLVVSGTTLYWLQIAQIAVGFSSLEAPAIKACETSSCATTTRDVYTFVYNPNVDYTKYRDVPFFFTVNAGEVLWTTYNGLRSCPVSGCSGEPATLTTKSSRQLVADERAVYFAGEEIDGGLIAARTPLYACAQSGCAEPTLMLEAPGHLQGFAAWGGRIYFTTATSRYATEKPRVASCDPASCASTLQVLADGESSASSIAVDAQGIYWTVDKVPLGSVRKCLHPDCPGGPTNLSDRQHGPGGLVINATNSFWADLDFQMLRYGK